MRMGWDAMPDVGWDGIWDCDNNQLSLSPKVKPESVTVYWQMGDLDDYDFSTGDAGASNVYNMEAGQIRVGG